MQTSMAPSTPGPWETLLYQLYRDWEDWVAEAEAPTTDLLAGDCDSEWAGQHHMCWQSYGATDDLIEEDIDPPVSSVGPAELPEPVEGSRESDWEDVAAHGTRETLGVLSSLACGGAGLSDRAEGFWAIYVRCTTLRSVWFTCTGSLLPRGAEGSGLGEAAGG